MIPYIVFNQFRGYNSNLDPTNAEPGTLVFPSQNVLTDGDSVEIRGGIKGLLGSVPSGQIIAFYNWQSQRGERAVRVRRDGTTDYFELWIDNDFQVFDAHTPQEPSYSFTPFLKTSNFLDYLIIGSGNPYVYAWSGAVSQVVSATSNSITVSALANAGFDSPAGFLRIGGTTYTYTGVSSNTFTGVTPNPSALTSGTRVIQALPNFTSIASNPISVISTLDNRLFYATSQGQLLVSAVGDFSNVTDSNQINAGKLAYFNGPVKALYPQDTVMYVSVGENDWYRVEIKVNTSDSTIIREAIEFKPIKSTPLQGAQSQALTLAIKNQLYYVNHEPALQALGSVENLEGPQIVELSDPIQPEFENYDFTNASLFYNRGYLYLALPQASKYLLYNFNKGWWEAPQTGAFFGFTTIANVLYGVSSTTAQYYELNAGTDDDGSPIDAVCALSYLSYGKRANYKSLNHLFAEGYFSPNTQITLTHNLEYEGAAGSSQKTISGSNQSLITTGGSDVSLGKQSLGKQSLGGTQFSTLSGLEKFRVFANYPRTDFYEHQLVFSTNTTGQRWILLAFGSDAAISPDRNTKNVI